VNTGVVVFTPRRVELLDYCAPRHLSVHPLHRLAHRLPLALAGPLTAPAISSRGPCSNPCLRRPRVFPH